MTATARPGPCLLAAALALAAAPAAACEMLRYTRVQASPNVVVFQAAEGTTGVVNGNVVLVTGRDASLVVDTGQLPGVARRIVGEIRAMEARPVTHVLHTHWHGDHIVANAAFREAWPQAKLVAHSHTIERAAFFYADYPAKAKQRLPIVMADLRKRRDEARGEEERLFLARTAECLEAVIPETDQMAYVPPDTVVDERLAVDLGGGVSVEIRHLGSGNTPGDLVAWVAPDRVVATGDLVVAPVPYAIGSDLDPWVATLDRLAGLGAAVVVPGHGPVMRDDAYVRDVRALVESTRRQVGELRAQGVSRADAPGRIDPGPFARHLTTPMRRQAFEQFFVRAVVAKSWPAEEKKPGG